MSFRNNASGREKERENLYEYIYIQIPHTYTHTQNKMRDSIVPVATNMHNV
jgi:hypothetical protein